MARQAPPASSQNRAIHALAGQSAKTPVLALRTSGAANRAYLQQDGSGRVSLYFRGWHYGVDDYVPNSLPGTRPGSCDGTAGQFICRQMLAHHGRDEDAWPALARRFLLQHARGPAADRSPTQRGPAATGRPLRAPALQPGLSLAHLFRLGTLPAS